MNRNIDKTPKEHSYHIEKQKNQERKGMDQSATASSDTDWLICMRVPLDHPQNVP